MSYSSTGILALLILIIINFEVLKRDPDKGALPVRKTYRRFLYASMAYFITDILWGFLYQSRLISLTYADTAVYFAMMALSVLFWTRCVIAYLDTKSLPERLLGIGGWVFFAVEIVFLLINFFRPILFRFDADGVYHAGIFRYYSLAFQLAMFLLSGIYAFTAARKAEGSLRLRHRMIGFSGVVMAAFVSLQILYPLLPVYAAGLLLSTCIIHIFVFEEEKEESRRQLKELLALEQAQKRELGSARRMAYIDGLTKVKNVHAYAEATDDLNKRIASGDLTAFGVIVCDLNNLKQINDTMGHETGDKYICEAAHFICRVFTHSPVFRIGGDEFAVLLEGDDYENRSSLLNTFETKMEENRKNGRVVVSAGLSDYRPGEDADYHSVFVRADHEMYLRKEAIKKLC